MTILFALLAAIVLTIAIYLSAAFAGWAADRWGVEPPFIFLAACFFVIFALLAVSEPLGVFTWGGH
jgi:hypothetical protein